MAKGAKPGERRGGRTKGVPNKATADIKEIARQYTSQAIEQIVALMSNAASEQVRFAAAKELIDRGYGKSPQSMEHTGPDGGPIKTSIEIAFVPANQG